ncbi:apolipoprotein lipid transfer particle [Xylocopa sonorina]|uniref:apolipoprotein lipid transfer particle n=1 Tax=Xylocopa sonorina TaxID=1818115 RepID=UPI00403AADCE
MTRNEERTRYGTIIFILVASIFLATIDETTQSEIIKDSTLCGRTKCKVSANRKFKYEGNVWYWYRYSVAVSTNLGSVNASSSSSSSSSSSRSSGFPGKRDESTIQLNADVAVRFTSPCEGTLKFENASLSHDPWKYNPEFPDRAGAGFKANLERFALRFSFDDGRVDELCPNKRDPVWALNLKRGVLSMLQNTMHRFDVDRRTNELDVNGVCETNYRLHEAKRTSLVLKKTKNLSDCLHGSKHFSIIRSNYYASPRSGIRGPRQPLLESRSDCELTIDRNIYEKIVCKELHRLQPLSNGNMGARTESTTILRLTRESTDDHGNSKEYEETGVDDDDEEEEEKKHVRGSRGRSRRTSLLYDYSKTPRTVHGELRSSRDLLKTMCKLRASSDELQQQFSETFTAFIQSTRLLDYPSLSQLFVRANGICKTGKKHIVDALPFVGSNAAVNVMKDLIIKGYIDQPTIDKWIIAFALIPRPNRETIRALSSLLDFHRQLSEAQFVLSYSATIHAFCSNNHDLHTRCENVEQVRRFLWYLEQKLEKGCLPRAHSPSTIKETMEALKAIGNMGLETERLSKLLRGCINDAGGFLPMEIRVASIDAHRRMPYCEKTRDLYFLNYYRNFTLDPEIRIASYLQVMRCPDYNVVKTIKHALKLEQVNQVGTFVWSHLTNLYNSASPTRVEIQSLLTDRDLDDKFNGDRRKFSRNYDGSFFSEEYNFGANYQWNLIFSPKSYIPRTATFNLSLDLFGESVNVLEVTTRHEGLEYYAEKFFGPDGPYSNEKVSGFFKHILRSFRAAPEQEETYWKRVKRLPNIIDNNFNDPKLSFSYKVFGNDLKYSMLHGDREIREALARGNPWEKFKEIVSGKEIHYENAAMFLDSTYVVPMISGLPLRLDFTGSAACNFKMSGLIDTKDISKGQVELVGNIAPSMSIDAVASMTVDATYKTAGAKLRTNVYSSGSVQIRLDAKGMRSIRLSLGLPNKRMEVFSVGTDILLTKGNGAELEERPIGVLIAGRHGEDATSSARPISIPKNVISNTSCTWSALDRLVGLKLCLDYQLSNVTKDPDAPYFLLSGPTLFKISLIKADPTAQNYLLEYKWEKRKEENVLRIAFDTPGSQVNRELSGTIFFDSNTHNVTVLLRSAGNCIVAKGIYKSTENETFVDIGFDINGTKHLDASLGYAIKRFHYGYTISPQMHLIVNNERIAALSGEIGNVWKNNVSQYNIDLVFRTKRVWCKLAGYVVRRNVSLAGDVQLEYQLQKMPKKETLRLQVSSSNRSSKTLTHKTIDLELRSTVYPQLNTMITAWYQQALGHLELHAEVNSSPHLMDDRHKLTAQLIISYSKMYFQNQDTKVTALIAITKPIQKLDIKIGINHYSAGPESKTSLLIGYAPGKEITLTVNLAMPRGLTFVMEGHANLTIPSFNSMLIDVRITERSKRTYDLDFAGTWFSGHNATARGSYSDRSIGTVFSHSLKLNVKSPSFANDVLINCKLYRNYSDIRASLHVEQLDGDRYAFILNHTVASSTNFLSYVEGRYKGNVYSVMTDVDVRREIRMEIHLDKWRDVHLALTGVNEERKKGFGAEVKWDANRDPALKLALFFSLDVETGPSPSSSPSSFPFEIEGDHRPATVESNVTGLISLSYPGRYVVGSCHVTARGRYGYIVDVTIDWTAEQTIRLFVETMYDAGPSRKTISLEARLTTPFENWRRTGLGGRYLQERDRIEASGGAHWKDSQRLTAELEGSTAITNKNGRTAKEWKANCGISSSVDSISSMTVNLTHKTIESPALADTRLLVRYHPNKVINAWSIWQLDSVTENVFNLTGNLHLESPVTRYRKTDMRCQLQVLSDWKLFGAANLELDRKTYTGRLIGDLRRFKESSIVLNVTTPLEKFSFVRGRFGFSERDRQVVAELVAPAGTIGFDAVCQFFQHEYGFNVRLLIATPLEILQNSLLVAKLNSREADFRVGYNKILVGFQGIWRYGNITDFHYSYLLFTPVGGLEETGIVAKLIVTRISENDYPGVDTEFSVRLADRGKHGETKIGVRFKIGPKPAPISIPIESLIIGTAITDNNRTTAEETDYAVEEEEEEEEEGFDGSGVHWRGEFELCPAIFPPITAELDVDNEGPTYNLAGVLRYLNGRILLDDTFWIEDLFNMRNELTVLLPFESVSEIVCSNAFIVDLENSNYTIRAAVNVKRNATWHETGVLANYVCRESETDDSRQTHSLLFNVNTPLEFLKFLDTTTSMDVQRNSYYRTRIGIRAPNSKIDILGSVDKSMGPLVDTTIAVEIDTPLIKLPRVVATVKRQLAGNETEKRFEISGEIDKPVSKSFTIRSDWYALDNRVGAAVVLRSWMDSLKNLEVRLSYLNAIASNDTGKVPGEVQVTVHAKHLDREYTLLGNYTGGTIDAEFSTATSSSPKVEPRYRFHGTTIALLPANDSTRRELNGALSNLVTGEVRAVSGFIELNRVDGCLRAIELTVHPRPYPEPTSSNAADRFVLKLKRETYRLNVSVLGPDLNGTLAANYINSFNWDVRTSADIPGEKDHHRVEVSTFMNVQVNGNVTLYVHAETPLPEIRNVTVTGTTLLSNETGDVRANGWFNEHPRWYVTAQWRLLYLMDMFGRVLAGYQGSTPATDSKQLDCRVFFKNPRRAFRNVDAGFDVDVDREKWRFAANATVGFRNHENIDGVFAVRLPPPNDDDHRFLVSYHANGGLKEASYVIGYNALRARTNYASDGSIRMDSRYINGHLRGSWGMLPVQSVNNLLNVTFDNKQIELRYSLCTPKFRQQETFVLLFGYDATLLEANDKHALTAELYYPASTNVASANVSYESLMNVNGTVNVILPRPTNVSRLECRFVVLTTLLRNKRYAKATWPRNTAILDSDYSYRSEKLNSDLEGVLYAELPLNTRHIARLIYGYKKRPQTTTGYSELTYNGHKVVNGRYNSRSEARAGFERDHTQITIENPYKPIGVVYVNQYEYSAGNDGTNYPTVEFKHVNLYQLDNRTALNVTGESRIGTTHTGQDVQLKAIHSNRTVQLKTDYQILPGEFDQTSWLSLADDVWLSYSINILNRTTEQVDNQYLVVNVSYPRRKFDLDGSYYITSDQFKSEVKLDWDRDKERPRTVGAFFDWANLSANGDPGTMQQRATVGFRHPSFAKRVYLTGELTKIDPRDATGLRITADYSAGEPSKLFTFSASFRNETELPSTRRYSYRVTGKHPSTRFDLDARGYLYRRESTLLESFNGARYKRGYSFDDTGKLNARLDLVHQRFLFQREYNEAVKYLNVRYRAEQLDRRHLVNGSIVNTQANLNATGDFFFDLDEKLIRMMLNYTPDAAESLRMYGRIPDARNAVFDIWRTYEDGFTVSDVSFYLKLNHSRLITSTLRWRPELKSDIVAIIKQAAIDAYESLNNDADRWKQYMKTETVNVISDVWEDAREDLEEFLDDWNNLKELQADLEELKIYLNNSYNSNDFYIKDLISFGIYVIDELSLRSQIESLPNILNEIYEIMGESGEAIRNSLLWLVEAIKNAFNKVPEIVAAILRGDMITQIASTIDRLLERYDKFVKDLHVSIIKSIENLWGKISHSISQQWNRFLLLLEPVFIRFIHYLDTVVWKASKELVDYFYDRKNDLIASPYFDRFNNFTQDIDKFYRDVKRNDVITNIRKYSVLVIRFLKERYFNLVPFGKELKDVFDEIVTELRELQKLPSIHYASEKMQQVYDRAYYVYQYLEVQAKIEAVVRLVHSKLTEISRTALQTESRYREAKTKFIFDPNEGFMCLEQKLPMSWHAFNQTPEFHEIPEFRAIADTRSYFASSNVTFWSIYRYKPYMDPLNWLPPFKAQAMIVGSQHFVTFDGRHVNFAGPCTYLLARDFVRDSFTILLRYQLRADRRVAHNIIVLLGNEVLELDIFNDSIKLGTTGDLALPIELENGDTYIYQTESVVTVQRKQNQFRLECYLKFDLCTLELSGWYHGKIGGILGTMNYEPMDDTTASNGIVTDNVKEFAESWSLDQENGRGCSRTIARNESIRTAAKSAGNGDDSTSSVVSEFCNDLFVNKSSEFISCFAVIEPNEYWKVCVLATSKSEACTVALSYMQVCMFHETYLRIPDVCSSCTMIDGSQLAEGQFVKLEGARLPSSTDVVFIVEGKECNRGAKQNRSIDQLVIQMSKELRDQRLTDNRWSLVVFGADGVFDGPRSVVFDGRIFTKNVARFIDYFDHVPIGEGSRDVFAAIAFASKLVFRAGVSKTFVLMPCSNCEPENQTLDYSVLHEVLLEHDITLHVLMDGDFEFEKQKLNKMFYGLDATKSYTRKDVRTLTGDVELRRQVKLSKSELGYCTPLALEINGTIFSGDKLRFDKLASIKKFASVFSKRVALTARPNPCQNCECTADNNGVTRMECIPCIYPTPVSVDYDTFNPNDSSLASLQPLNLDYGQIDVDDT